MWNPFRNPELSIQTNKQQSDGTASGQTFFEDPLDFYNLFVWSCRQNLHQDVFICAETLLEQKQENIILHLFIVTSPYIFWSSSLFMYYIPLVIYYK